jgi:hypothetical protein
MNVLAIQAGTPVTESEYWERVRSTEQVVAGLEAEPEESVRSQLDELASEWGQVTEVQLPDGTVVPVDSSYLVQELKADPPDLERLESLLESLSRAHEEYPHDVFTIQDIEPLKEILARPEFQWQTEQAVETPAWLQTILDAFFRLMERLVYGLQVAIYYGRVPLMIAVVLLFLLSLYFISRNLTRNLVREAQLAAQKGKGDEFLTSSGAMRQAQSLSSQGDYRNAVRYLYLSSLLVLDERGVLHYDRSRTNLEYLRSISSKPELSQPLGDVIDVFDRVWYGHEDVDETTFQSYVKHVDELREKKE